MVRASQGGPLAVHDRDALIPCQGGPLAVHDRDALIPCQGHPPLRMILTT